MEGSFSENLFDPHEILEVPKGASFDVINGAYRAKERGLLNKKNEGLAGVSGLVPENDFERLKLARKTLLEREFPNGEVVTDELEASQDMKYRGIADQIMLDERQRAIFAYLVNNDLNSNLPTTIEGVAYFYESFKSESDYEQKVEEVYQEVLNTPDADREQRHNDWNKYVQAGIRLRSTLFPN